MASEKLRKDLSFFHAAVERFTEAAVKHESRLESLRISLQDAGVGVAVGSGW